MEFLKKFTSYFVELRKILLTVNRIVYGIDQRYVQYRWISQIYASVQTLGLFMVGAVMLGNYIEKPTISWQLLFVGTGLYLVYLLISMLISSWANERRVMFRTLLHTQLDLERTEHLAKLDVGRLVDPAFVEISSLAARRGISSIHSLWNAQLELTGAGVALLLGSLVLLSLDPLIGVLALTMAVPSVLQRWFQEQKRRELDEAETLVYRQRNEVFWATTSSRVSVFMRFLVLTRKYLTRYKALSDILLVNVRDVARYERRWTLVVEAIGAVCIGLLVFYFGSGVVAGKYSYIQIGAILGSLRIAASSLRDFGWAVGQIEQERRDYLYLEKFLETKPLVDESHCSAVALKNIPELVIEEVSFKYPTSEKFAVHGCSLSIKPGEKVALVGPNGCGKTTFLRLLSRIYLPSSGRIWADEHALDSVLQSSWIDHAVLVTQSAILPGMELGRAMTGDPSESLDKNRLGIALVHSGAASLMDLLPHGLNTWIGEEWPQGKGFSTGELQRFALAATFYRFLDPKVYVAMFDEPTANCDADTKARFYTSITKASEFAEKTVIVTLHDPLYLKHFDRVIQFESGSIVKDLRGKDQVEKYRTSILEALAGDL